MGPFVYILAASPTLNPGPPVSTPRRSDCSSAAVLKLRLSDLPPPVSRWRSTSPSTVVIDPKTGSFGYPIELAARVALKTVLDALPDLESVCRIRFVLLDDRTRQVHLQVPREFTREDR